MLQHKRREISEPGSWHSIRSFLVVIRGRYKEAISLAKEVSQPLYNLPSGEVYEVSSNDLNVISSLASLEARGGAYLIGVYNGSAGQTPINIIFLEDTAYRQCNQQWVKSNLALDPSTWEVTTQNPLHLLSTHYPF